TKAAKKAPKTKKAPPAPKLKAVDTKKSDLKKKRLQNPVEHFLEIWKPKVETFEMGLQKFLTAIGVSDREKPEVEESVREKLMAFMRKAPLSGAIEEQLSERFRRDRIHKFESIWSMKPKSYVLL